MQDINLIKLKLKVNDTYEKDGKITTKFEPSDNSDAKNKTYLDPKASKIEGHLSLIDKNYKDIELPNSKQSLEEVVERALKTNFQITFDKRSYDSLIIGTKN